MSYDSDGDEIHNGCDACGRQRGAGASQCSEPLHIVRELAEAGYENHLCFDCRSLFNSTSGRAAIAFMLRVMERAKRAAV